MTFSFKPVSPSERLTGKQILHHDYFGCVVANSMDELLIGLQQKEIEEVGPIPKVGGHTYDTVYTLTC